MHSGGTVELRLAVGNWPLSALVGTIPVMPVLRDEAMVLKRLDYSETSQVLVLFGRAQGKVRAIAKGIKRSTKTRFAAGVDLLELGSVTLSSRRAHSDALVTLTEWKQRIGFTGLREKLPRLYAAQYAAETTAHLTEDWDPHEALFDALVDCLGKLAEADRTLPVLVTYQQALLTEIGSYPQFESCVRCGRATELTHFSSFEGGMICLHCEPVQVEKRALSRSALTLLTHVDVDASATRQMETTVPPPEIALIGAFDVLNYHISHLMGKEPLLAAKIVPPVQRRTLR